MNDQRRSQPHQVSELIKREKKKKKNVMQSQDTRGRDKDRTSAALSTYYEKRKFGTANGEVPPNKELQNCSEDSYQQEGGVFKNRVWRCKSQESYHRRRMYSESNVLQSSSNHTDSRRRINSQNEEIKRNKVWRSESEDRTHQKNRSFSTDGLRKKPDSHSQKTVDVAIIIKQLAQLYGGYVDVKKAADLVQICNPDFFNEVKIYVCNMSPDRAFLNDLSTFCHSVLISLPSTICAHLEDILTYSLRESRKSGDIVLQEKFARLKETFTERVKTKKEVLITDFRSFPILPVDVKMCLRLPEDTDVNTVEGYLSAQFFSLFTSFVGRIQTGITDYIDSPLRMTRDIHFFRGVRFLNPRIVDEHVCIVTTLSPASSFSVGTLLCYSVNNFWSLLYATVVQADTQVVIELLDEIPFTKHLFERDYVVADTRLLTEPSYSILKDLQKIKVLPMQQYIVEKVAICSHPEDLKDERIPTVDQLDLDDYQYEAFKGALTQDLSLVVGPPGTGKTYVGSQLARVVQKPVVVLCASQSALDSFLQSLRPLSTVRLTDKVEHQLGKSMLARKTDVLTQIRQLVLDLTLLTRRDGIVSLTSLRKANVMSDNHFKCFVHKPDTVSVFYNWLVEEASSCDSFKTLHPQVEFSEKQKPDIVAVQSTLKWAERLENIKKKRSDIINSIRDLQERWGRGEDVTEEMDSQKNQYEQLSFRLKRLKIALSMAEANDRLLLCRGVWLLSPNDRWRLYFAWVAKLRDQLLEKLLQLHPTLTQINKNLAEVDELVILKNLQKADVVGTTVRDATRLRSLLQRLQPKTVIVDEATKITELQLVACVPPTCQRLVLLGETRPVQWTANKKGTNPVNHIRSLVDRLMDNGVQVTELQSQHRMQPNVARFIQSAFYPSLKTVSSVAKDSVVKGIVHNGYFITHEHQTEKIENAFDYQNLHEADFLLALCHHLVLQGYTQEDIVILTMYPGQQRYLLDECKSSQLLQDIRVSLVEEFQGKECRLALLSLVWHEQMHSGPLVSMMLSRAKEGLYIIGNLKGLVQNSIIWQSVQKTLEKYDAVGPQLQLKCQAGHQETLSDNCDRQLHSQFQDV
ncbi:NFX1-type zinc finger-containing protein 1-like isoform X2 [Periplaneta americana]|uniref:NFX1-type zinc finger-containing protein 1-like isoform X2 n=1 Tax=Periplaneta americana TaxID=6978 RepID=UPI0037E8E88F